MENEEVKPKVLDLFSGIGGFSYAFEAEGFETTAFCEIDPEASLVLKGIWPDIPNYEDISKMLLTEQQIRKFLRLHGPVAVLTGGVPCQPASLIGKRKGTKDHRWLWPEVLRVTAITRPDFCLFENPAGILSLQKGHPFKDILSGLAKIGYDCWWDCVRASRVGAGHRRERLYLVAANSRRTRLEGQPRNALPVQRGKGQDRLAPQPRVFNPSYTGKTWFQTQSPCSFVVNGIPGGLVKAALRCLGNSVVPQVVQIYAKSLRTQYP